MKNEIKFRDYPILGWASGAGMLAWGAYFILTHLSTPQYWFGSVAAILLGLTFLVFGYGLTITADRQTRTPTVL